MNTTWMVMREDKILHDSNSEVEAYRWAWDRGFTRNDCDIVKVPEPHYSMEI